MKKLLMMILCSFAMISFAKAEDNMMSQLPPKALEFIQTHFADRQVAYTKMDGKNYEVAFVDGDEIEFYKNGEWKEINCRKSEVPSIAVPKEILQIVEKNYSGNKIVDIERDGNNYEVKLSNRLKLTFNSKFSVIDMDMDD